MTRPEPEAVATATAAEAASGVTDHPHTVKHCAFLYWAMNVEGGVNAYVCMDAATAAEASLTTCTQPNTAMLVFTG